MKKLLYLAAFVAAVTFTACNKGIGSLPTELRQEVEQADQEIKTALEFAKHSGEMQEMQQYGLEFDYEGVALEGRSIIFQFKLGGDMMNIISFNHGDLPPSATTCVYVIQLKVIRQLCFSQILRVIPSLLVLMRWLPARRFSMPAQT